MPAKLDRTQWASAVRQKRAGSTPKRFTDQIKKQKANRPKSLAGTEWKQRVRNRSNKTWTDRVELSRKATKGGGRHRAKLSPSRSKTRQRKVGGILKSNQAKSRATLTEKQRQALPKTGDKVPKKGINSGNWAYDHRKAVAARRARAQTAKTTGNKRGINAEKWHYDHQKAKAGAKTKSGPTTHVSAEKKRTQQRAIAQNRPQRPSRPRQPQAKPPPKARVNTPRK